MDHHYVPQFYLKQWAGPDGQIPNYRWLRNSAIFGRVKSSKGTGLEPDLYAREHVPPEERNLVETGFFSVLDDKAARVHARLFAPGCRALSIWQSEPRLAPWRRSSSPSSSRSLKSRKCRCRV